MVRTFSFAPALAAAAAACRPATPQLEPLQRAPVTDSVRAVLDSLATWMSTQDAGRPFAIFHDSAPGNAGVSDGRITTPSYGALVARTRTWTPPAGARFAWDTEVEEEVLALCGPAVSGIPRSLPRC